MFYNVENLFDTYDDSLKDDDEFLPGGAMHWSYTRYKNKLNSLYKTFSAAGEWNMPAVIALCEVENRKVLEDLISKTNLLKYDFGIVHEESPDQRGIDVCMLYRKDCAALLEYRYLIPDLSGARNFKTRSVLYSKLLIQSDTLHIIVNHWPSKRGGVLAGEDLRMIIAVMVKELCDSIQGVNGGNCNLIICGDFNSSPGDNEIRTLTGNGSYEQFLVDLSERPAERGEGTYRYRGIWEMIDHVIVSKSMLNRDSGLHTGYEHFRIFRPGFLLENDPVYPGSTPFATYHGYRYQGGYSDHLPVLIDIYSK